MAFLASSLRCEGPSVYRRVNPKSLHHIIAMGNEEDCYGDQIKENYRLSDIIRCVLASLKLVLSVRPLVGTSVGRYVRPSVTLS